MRTVTTTALLLASVLLPAQTPEPYCNTAFNYCLEYPAELQRQSGGDTSTLAAFQSADEAVQLQVSGHSNPEQWSLEDIYYFTFEDKLRRNPDLKILEEAFEANRFKLAYQEGNRLYYHQLFRRPTQYVHLSFYLPADQPERLERLQRSLKLEFPGQ
jgi:hypothetical protein